MIPESLQWLRETEAGRSWLAALPRLVEECVRRWALRIGTPYPGSYVSVVLPADLPDGTAAALKLQFPHRESEHEAQALARWDGDGAVRLLDHDHVHRALLIERCEPGTHLSEFGAQVALEVMIGLLPRLWKAATSPFRALADEATMWIEHLPETWEKAGRPFERALIDAAIETLTELSSSQGEQVLLHQDLHADNVLRAEREPWLVIDPKPLHGEREFGIASVVRSYELGHSRALVLGRLDRLSGELGLDRQRACRWAFSQTLAWAFEGDRVLPRHVETARWLLGSA
ncbi:MAG: aminoglycoside phosphotransferase family protein [Actinomycetota bacterium]|nr:aminoglycoside phosphotransferase family protein [Actinomycetota bacterium]